MVDLPLELQMALERAEEEQRRREMQQATDQAIADARKAIEDAGGT